MSPEELLAHSEFIQALAISLVRDEDQALDAVQETWRAALEHPPASGKPLKPWLVAVLRNRLFSFFRKEKSRAQREASFVDQRTTASPAEIIEKEEIRRKLIEAVLEIAEPFRSAIIFRYYEGQKPAEIAKRLGVPLGTVKSRLKRGLERLRKKLDVEYGGSRKEWVSNLTVVTGISGIASETAVAGSSIGWTTGVGIMKLKAKALSIAIALLCVAVPLVYFHILDDETGNSNEGFLQSSAPKIRAVAIDEDVLASGESGEATESSSFEREAIAPEVFPIELSGFVENRNSGQPLDNVAIRVHLLSNKTSVRKAEATTDKNGVFRLEMMDCPIPKKSSLYFIVSRKGYKQLESQLPIKEEALFIKELTFHLEEDEAHTLQVVDAQKHPISGAKVEWIQPEAPKDPIVQYTNAQGKVQYNETDLGWMSGYPESRYTLLRITMKGMNVYYYGFYSGKGCPKEVTLTETEAIAGHVIDKVTGDPIAGAKVIIRPKPGHPLSHLLPSWESISDSTGQFDIGPISFEGYIRFEQYAFAPGYSKFRPDTHDVDFLVQMLPRKCVKKVRAIIGQTGMPLACMPLSFSSRGAPYFFTDQDGYFDFPIDERGISPRLIAPGYIGPRLSTKDPRGSENDPIILKFEAHAKERIRVMDVLGRTIDKIRVQIIYERDGKKGWSDAFTDGLGEACFMPYIPIGTEVKIRIFQQGKFNKDFIPFCSEPFPFGSSNGEIRTFVLERAFRFNRIRVVDENDLPLAEQVVVGEFLLEDNTILQNGPGINIDKSVLSDGTDNAWMVQSETDEKGLAELTVPPFTKGLIYVLDRPDTQRNVNLEDIIHQKETVLVAPFDYLRHSGITGSILSEDGSPIDDLSIKIKPSDVKHWEAAKILGLKTDINGRFAIPADHGKEYTLFFHSFKREMTEGNIAYFHWMEKKGIKAGDYLKIYVASGSNRVSAELMDCGVPITDCEVWLEDESGFKVDTKHQTLKFYNYQSRKGQTSNVHASYYDVPLVRLRAVVRTESGQLFHSKFHVVEQGCDLHIEINNNT